MIEKVPKNIFAVITLEKEMYACQGQKLIGYKYDIDNDEKICRIAFHGKIQAILNAEKKIKLYKEKERKGVIDRVVDNYTLIVKDLFNKQFNLQQFIGKEVTVQQTGQVGKIDGSFGKSGKVRVCFKESLQGAEIEGTEIVLKYNKWYQ